MVTLVVYDASDTTYLQSDMRTGIYPYIQWTWICIGGVWLAAALASKRAARTEPALSRLAHVAVMAAACALLYSAARRAGPLAWRFVPDTPAIAWTGFGLTAAGCAFAIWARLLLGGNWSASVTVKRDHELIRRGPYTIVRHPIYSGLLLGVLGTAVAFGELRGLLALPVAFAGWLTKSRLEEAFMIQQFGAAYAQYQREVKALIPFVL